MPDYAAAIAELRPHLVTLRHDLHAHPELAFEEKRTAARVLAELQPLENLKIRSGLAGTGIVALLNADHRGPCVALRADMDALPLQEDHPDLLYASTEPDRMHACGHDGHTACLVGAAQVLSGAADELPGKVKFIFQPAEESHGGGCRLVEDEGVLADPTVSAVFALHGWPDAELGQVIVGQGPILAAAAALEITVSGRGAHAAYPHEANDVVLASAQIVTALQSVASRWDPVDPVVISICHLQAGHAHNVLPERCRMRGTIRALRQGSYDALVRRVRHIVATTAHAHGCTAAVDFLPGYPALANDPTCARIVADVAADLFGADSVITDPPPSMGGEDFAFYARRVPAALFRIGVAQPDGPSCPPLHSPRFDFPDAAIDIGVRLHCEIAHRCLAEAPLWPCG